MRSRDEAVEEKLRPIDLPISDVHHVRLAAIGTGRLDATVDVEGAEDAEGIPSAVCIPPALIRVNAVRGWYCRKWVRHPDFISRRIEHEGMCFVKVAPAVAYLAFVAKFSRDWGTTELHEGGVCLVAKLEQFRVDPSTLPRSVPDTRLRGQRNLSSSKHPTSAGHHLQWIASARHRYGDAWSASG